jgi:hypothetical protein
MKFADRIGLRRGGLMVLVMAALVNAIPAFADMAGARNTTPVTSATRASSVLTPSGAGQNAGSCRDFELQVSRNGKTEIQPSRACRTGDGTWQMVKWKALRPVPCRGTGRGISI